MNINELPYAVVQRLRLVDVTLYVVGVIRREMLTEYFGISTPQASGDFSKYQEIAPNNMVYDLSAKCYRRSETFQRVWK